MMLWWFMDDSLFAGPASALRLLSAGLEVPVGQLSAG